MAARRRNVKGEERRELAQAVPVISAAASQDEIEALLAQSDDIEFEPVVTKRPEEPTKPPLVYLSGAALREAHVDILALRAQQLPIPAHLSINDHLGVCGMRAVRLLKSMMLAEGVTDMTRAREFADRVIPTCPSM